MPNTIEVPISLIKSGDLDAIRELLPKPNLFGRWAEHPEYGRVVVISAHPDQFNAVWLARSEKVGTSGKAWQAQVYLDSLTLDPVELTTLEECNNAPLGTVVAKPQGNSYQKVYADCWESVDDDLGNGLMATSGPWTILRWGWGEQQ